MTNGKQRLTRVSGLHVEGGGKVHIGNAAMGDQATLIVRGSPARRDRAAPWQPPPAAPRAAPLRLFCCYAPGDRELGARLAEHLTQLQREQMITYEGPEQILAGSSFWREFASRLVSTDLFVILFSASLLADPDWFEVGQRALAAARSAHTLVLPVIARSCDMASVLGPDFIPAVRPHNRVPVVNWDSEDAAWAEVTEAIRTICTTTPGQRPVLD